MKTFAFVSNMGAVGKTSLVYHLAWMFAELGYRVMAADLCPQANLTAMFLDEDQLAELWEQGDVAQTILGAVAPLLRGVGDVSPATLLTLHDQLALLPGDVGLSSFEGVLAEGWVDCHRGDARGYVVTSSLATVLTRSATQHRADVVLVDLGPTLGALNRASLLAADYIIIPIAADLFSVVGLKSLGPSIGQWRVGWRHLLDSRPEGLELMLPEGGLRPLGYVTMQHSVRREGRPSKAHRVWMQRIPAAYRSLVLELDGDAPASVDDDPECLAVVKHHHSLMFMAQDARKPIFRLTPADGALGSHAFAVRDAHRDFEQLARTIAERSGATC